MSLDRFTSILPAQFFEGAPQDVADDEQQPAVEVRLGESAANKPSASSSAYDDEDFDMFSSANEEDSSSSSVTSSYGWMNNMKPKKFRGSYVAAFLFFLVFVMVISMASVGITVHRQNQNKSVVMTSNAKSYDCEETNALERRVRALASSPDAATSTQGDEKNGGEGIEKRLLKGDQVKRGLGVPSPTPVKGDAAGVPSPTPVKRVLGVPSRRLQGGCSGTIPDGDVCTNAVQNQCDNSNQSDCSSCDAQECPGTSPVVYICGATSAVLSNCPTESPSEQPSESPSDVPSEQPSESPSTSEPTASPSDVPSESPSDVPSEQPSESPSDVPSEQPSVSNAPSMVSYFYICNSMNPLLTCFHSPCTCTPVLCVLILTTLSEISFLLCVLDIYTGWKGLQDF